MRTLGRPGSYANSGDPALCLNVCNLQVVPGPTQKVMKFMRRGQLGPSRTSSYPYSHSISHLRPQPTFNLMQPLPSALILPLTSTLNVIPNPILFYLLSLPSIFLLPHLCSTSDLHSHSTSFLFILLLQFSLGSAHFLLITSVSGDGISLYFSSSSRVSSASPLMNTLAIWFFPFSLTLAPISPLLWIENYTFWHQYLNLPLSFWHFSNPCGLSSTELTT